MPATLSKLKFENSHSAHENNGWYIKSKDNPKDLVDTPYQQELRKWKKTVNGILKTRKEARKECQQSSPNYTAN